MVGPLVVLMVLVVWNLRDGELSIGEAALAVGLCVVSLIVTGLMHLSPAVPVVTAVVVDIVLIVKIFGGDLQIR